MIPTYSHDSSLYLSHSLTLLTCSNTHAQRLMWTDGAIAKYIRAASSAESASQSQQCVLNSPLLQYTRIAKRERNPQHQHINNAISYEWRCRRRRCREAATTTTTTTTSTHQHHQRTPPPPTALCVSVCLGQCVGMSVRLCGWDVFGGHARDFN